MLTDDLPHCRHRAASLGDDRWQCGSPRLVLPRGFVDGSECRLRCRVIDHDLDDPADPRQVVHVPGPHVAIAVGVLTAPRDQPTLAYTLRQLRGGGFTGPIHVFAEPGSEVPEENEVIVTRRKSRLGLWDNWRSTLASLLDNTDAPFILTCEDDLLVAQSAHLALQHAVRTFEHGDWGVASLYTPWFNVRGLTGFRGWKNLDDDRPKWGALAYCFTREAAETLLGSVEVIEHTGNAIDLIVPQAVRRLGWAQYYHWPSLVSHIGCGNSTIGHPPWRRDSLAVDFHMEYGAYQPLVESFAPGRKPGN